jgi:endonuclease I
MRKSSIKSHLKPYSIHGKRSTTIHHAFASAVAPLELYDEDRVNEALRFLGYQPEEDLWCFYCQSHPAETWDHLEALVQDKKPSKYGHTLGNLVPACKKCNSEKGNKSFAVFLSGSTDRIEKLQAYQQAFLPKDESIPPDHLRAELDRIESSILRLMKEADELIIPWRQAGLD